MAVGPRVVDLTRRSASPRSQPVVLSTPRGGAMSSELAESLRGRRASSTSSAHVVDLILVPAGHGSSLSPSPASASAHPQRGAREALRALEATVRGRRATSARGGSVELISPLGATSLGTRSDRAEMMFTVWPTDRRQRPGEVHPDSTDVSGIIRAAAPALGPTKTTPYSAYGRQRAKWRACLPI